MADVNRTVDIIFRSTDQTGSGVSSIEKGLTGLGDEAANASKNVDATGKSVERLGGTPRSAVIGLGDAFKALAASLVVKDFIEANVAFESFERTMVLVKGSTEEANAEFEYLTQLSNKLGLEVLDAAKNYASLSAATKGTNIEGAQTRQIFEAVSIAMSSLGKSSADTQGALQAITQIVSKGTVSMEELRQQLGERLPGAFQIAADSMGLTTKELNDLVASGKLTAEEFLPKLAAGLKLAFGDVSYVDTYTASLNRLKNAATDAELQIGRSGAFDVLTKSVQVGTLAITGAIAAFEVLGNTAGITLAALTTLDFSHFGEDIAAAMLDGANKTNQARDALFGLSDASDKASGAQNNLLHEVQNTGAYIIQALPPIDKVSKALGLTAEQAQKAAIELEKIASNERIKNIEAKVELNIAALEADAKKAVAIIESISNTVTSTGNSLDSLFGNLNDADSISKRFAIEDQIKLENERRDEALDLQKRMTESQLRLNKLREDALRGGDAVLTVSGDGLQPHLEAFMWEILKTIQTRVNSDGLDMLLGT